MPSKKPTGMTDEQKGLLLQMVSQHLMLTSDQQQERLQKLIEAMSDSSLRQIHTVVKIDLVATIKRQMTVLRQQLTLMG